jgi:hypothetical protein
MPSTTQTSANGLMREYTTPSMHLWPVQPESSRTHKANVSLMRSSPAASAHATAFVRRLFSPAALLLLKAFISE